MAAQTWKGFVLLNDLTGVTPAAVASPKDMSLNPPGAHSSRGPTLAEPYFPTFPFPWPRPSFIPWTCFLKDQRVSALDFAGCVYAATT